MSVPRRTMNIFLPCWGPKHIDLFKECLAVSLKWERNNFEIKGSTWSVVTEDSWSLEEIRKIIKDIDATANVRAFLEEKIKYNAPTVLLKVLKETIIDCLKEETPLLMATPDYIYGDGTIEALKKIGNTKGSCVGMAHMRTTKEMIEELKIGKSFSNDFLLSTAMRYPHPSWKDSEESANPGRTYFGGISWAKIDEFSLAVRHRLPAPFYANFLEEDLNFFSSSHNHPHDHTFALWDHAWPSALIQSGRFRYIGSSEIATMVEVTEYDENVPPINPYGTSNKDDYANNNYHNHICKQFVSIFRS